jgi:hypothetical protein
LFTNKILKKEKYYTRAETLTFLTLYKEGLKKKPPAKIMVNFLNEIKSILLCWSEYLKDSRGDTRQQVADDQ